MANPEIEKLRYFFSSCPLYINGNSRQLSLFPPHDTVVVLDFRGENDDLEKVVKRGLSWVGRRKFAEFGINGIAADEQRWEVVLLKGKYRTKVGKAVKPVHLYRTAAVEPVYLTSQQRRAQTLVEQWSSERKIPDEIIGLWNDNDENQAKLREMIGRQVYKANDNKGYGRPLQELLRSHQDKYRISRRARELFWTQWNSEPHPRGPLTITELESIVSLPASHIPDEFTEELEYAVLAEEKIEEATCALAQAAYDIRMTYPCQGNSVREGLVHKQDYDVLYERAKEHSDREVLCRILANGLGVFEEPAGESLMGKSWEGESEGDVRFVVAASMEVAERARPYLPERYALAPDDYQRIGHLRVEEFLQEGKIPYTREARVMAKILTMYLNRKQFQKEVNRWLEKYQQERVRWEELEFTRKAA